MATQCERASTILLIGDQHKNKCGCCWSYFWCVCCFRCWPNGEIDFIFRRHLCHCRMLSKKITRTHTILYTHAHTHSRKWMKNRKIASKQWLLFLFILFFSRRTDGFRWNRETKTNHEIEEMNWTCDEKNGKISGSTFARRIDVWHSIFHQFFVWFQVGKMSADIVFARNTDSDTNFARILFFTKFLAGVCCSCNLCRSLTQSNRTPNFSQRILRTSARNKCYLSKTILARSLYTDRHPIRIKNNNNDFVRNSLARSHAHTHARTPSKTYTISLWSHRQWQYCAVAAILPRPCVSSLCVCRRRVRVCVCREWMLWRVDTKCGVCGRAHEAMTAHHFHDARSGATADGVRVDRCDDLLPENAKIP